MNASRCEGLYLPLMEFMSCGTPAIAPDHSAMADYMDAQVGFVVPLQPGARGLAAGFAPVVQHPALPAELGGP